MFGLRRKTQGQLMRRELAETMEHLQKAGIHAAGGAARVVAPRYQSARGFVAPAGAKVRGGWRASVNAMGPFMDAAVTEGRKANRDAAKAAKKKNSKGTSMGRKWPLIVGVLATGAAVGGAYAVSKRRNGGMNSITSDAKDALDSTKSALGNASDRAAGSAKDLGNRGSSMMDSATNERPSTGGRSPMGNSVDRTMKKGKETSEDLLKQSGF